MTMLILGIIIGVILTISGEAAILYYLLFKN